METFLKLISIFLLLFLSGFFSASEAALFSAVPPKDGKGWETVKLLLSDPKSLITSILIGNEFVNICACALFASIVVERFGDEGKWISTAIMVPTLLIFGEIIPKSLALAKRERICLFVSPIIYRFKAITTPIRFVLELLPRLLFVGKKARAKISTSDMEKLLLVGEKEGIIEEKERFILSNLLRFSEKKVEEIMTEREKVFALPINTSVKDALGAAVASHYSRIPIYGETIDDIRGILYVKDLAPFKLGKLKDDTKVSEIMKSPYFVSPDIEIGDLFSKFREKRVHMAIVKRGEKTLGLVTMEDILEEIFGEIYDEYDL